MADKDTRRKEREMINDPRVAKLIATLNAIKNECDVMFRIASSDVDDETIEDMEHWAEGALNQLQIGTSQEEDTPAISNVTCRWQDGRIRTGVTIEEHSDGAGEGMCVVVFDDDEGFEFERRNGYELFFEVNNSTDPVEITFEERN